MAIQEIFQRMREGEVAAHSELGTRDEMKQTKQYVQRLQKFKASVGVKAHALVMKDIVVPFNPFTGETDDKYNDKVPFRPILLASQTIDGIKSACAENADLAAKWEKVLHAGDGKIDWSAPVSLQDYYLFKAAGYVKPRIMTYATVSLNFNGLEGFSKFKQKFTVDPTELDDGYMYPAGKSPAWNDASSLFYSMLRQEADEKVESLKRNGASNEQITAARSEVFSKSPVSFVGPTNLIPFLYIPMNAEPKEFEPDNYSGFEGYVRWYGYQADKWSGCIDEAMKNNMYDEHIDFFDFTLRTPSATETKADGRVYTDDDALDLYKAMTITNTDGRASIWNGSTQVGDKVLDNKTAFNFLWGGAAAYFEHSQEESFKDGESFEKLMAVSNRFRPITTVMDSFLPACNAVFQRDFADSKYFTEDIKRRHSKFLIAMNKDNALALAEVDQDELDEAASEQAKSLSELVSNVRAAEGDGDAAAALQDMALGE